MKKLIDMKRLAVVVALLLAVNIHADAQFGKLKNLAKKAIEKVEKSTDKSDDDEPKVTNERTDRDNSKSNNNSNVSSSQDDDEDPVAIAQRQQREIDPVYREKYNIEQAGGMDKYLGLTDADGQVVYKYYKMKKMEDYPDFDGRESAHEACQIIVDCLRLSEGS